MAVPVAGLILHAMQPLCVDILLSTNLKLTWKLSFFTVAAEFLRLYDLKFTFEVLTLKFRAVLALKSSLSLDLDLDLDFETEFYVFFFLEEGFFS